MERLKVKNFLIIKKCDIDVGRLTLIIGPQASGKSIIAKLLYFFRRFISAGYLFSARNSETKTQLQKRSKTDFEEYFPEYAWKEQEFEIVYQINEFELSLVHRKGKNGRWYFKLDYSKNLRRLHQKLKSAYRKRQTGYPSKEEAFWEIICQRTIINPEFRDTFCDPIFIPAGRSFFANLHKNIFSFLASNIDIDPFIKGFGSDYEVSKKIYSSQSKTEIGKKINMLVEAILAGKYKYENQQDWITHKNKKVNLANASSGQREALPMLMILSVFPFSLSQNRNRIFFYRRTRSASFSDLTKAYCLYYRAYLQQKA